MSRQSSEYGSSSRPTVRVVWIRTQANPSKSLQREGRRVEQGPKRVCACREAQGRPGVLRAAEAPGRSSNAAEAGMGLVEAKPPAGRVSNPDSGRGAAAGDPERQRRECPDQAEARL